MRLSNDDRRSSSYATSLVTAIVAAGAMFYLDPQSGRRRRALLRDQANRLAHGIEEFAAKATRDARQRTRGLYENTVSGLRRTVVDDEIVQERVHAELGRLSAHPGGIEVACSSGTVRLRGDILENEVATVLRGVGRVRGVENVVNEMREHREAGNVPSLQGGNDKRLAPRFEYLQENWSPAPRLLAGSAGLAMMATGLIRHSLSGYTAAAGGAALLLRSIFNMPLTQLVSARTPPARKDGVLVQKTIEVYADIDETYACWRDLEQFPAFMSHVKEVRKIDDRRYHWKVDGPAGVPVEWDAEITAEVPAELLAWRSVPEAAVQSSGVVQFEPTAYGGTRLHVRMSYRPPANVMGHAVAKIFGRDPQRQIDADLLRFKAFIETERKPEQPWH